MSEKQEYKPVEMEVGVGVPLFDEELATVASVKVMPMIEVGAPATLPEGYAFEAQVGDRVFTVAVPQGGIEEGQQFLVATPALEGTRSSSIPVGTWKDGIYNCFKYGLCFPCALAQVMQRLYLNWLANPIQEVPPNTKSAGAESSRLRSPSNGTETPSPPEAMQPSFSPRYLTADSPLQAQSMQRRPAYLLHRDLVIGKGSYGQPIFSPHDLTADSPLQAQSMQRRTAFLLHRDLVIEKGSYAQVCIASGGETEGHTSGRSGKRKKFACKCLMLRNDPRYIAKLREEVTMLRELQGHANVIRLFDVFCVDNELFIITELGRGGDLFQLLAAHPKHGVTEAYAAKTVAEMLSAVSFLHSKSICHRDLKLENWVLVSGRDVWSPLKLIDFGLSTHFTPGRRLSRVCGSAYYVAPEVLKKSYTEACDLWSLGVIVYMLLSGAPPFYGKNDEAIKASIVHGVYTFPEEWFREVSEDAKSFVKILLQYDMNQRYTAEEALGHSWLASHLDPSDGWRLRLKVPAWCSRE